MWSAGFQRCWSSMSFVKGETFPESIGDGSAKCASSPHLTMTQLQFGCCGPQSCTGPLCLKLQCFLSLNQIPYRPSVTLNPIIDFFKCQRETVAFWRAETWPLCSSSSSFLWHFVLLWYNHAGCVLTCPDVVLLFFFVPLPRLPLCWPSGYIPARPLAPSQQPPQWAPFRANHHSAASRAAFTEARVWTALISLTPM